MSHCAIVGINWGDEGKGRMVDLLTERYDVVIRYQGGGNAGHTVVNEYGKFALHLLPSGIFRPGVLNILASSRGVSSAMAATSKGARSWTSTPLRALARAWSPCRPSRRTPTPPRAADRA